jgi:glutamyl/glutaminyl-tRNA synthetase
LYARQQGGAFILRFEDTDLERHVEGAERDIRDALEWLGLAPDEGPFAGGEHGPYRQSERAEIYREHAERLLAEGRAYRCYCTPEELEARRAGARAERGDVRYDGRCRRLSSEEESRLIASGPPASIRFRVEPDVVHYRDRVRGDLTVEGEQLGDQVIVRSDGRPTYNFAVVVDDLLMGITHVIRGAGHLSNTPKQVLLYWLRAEASSRSVPAPRGCWNTGIRDTTRTVSSTISPFSPGPAPAGRRCCREISWSPRSIWIG